MSKGELQSKKTIQATAIIDTTVVPPVITEEKETKANKNIIYKRFGTDNLYPQALAALYRKSVTLRSIIKSQLIFTLGGGFNLNELEGSSTEWILNVNAKQQSLEDLFEHYFIDRRVFGNTYLEVITDRKRSFLNIEHLQTVKVRRHKNQKDVIIHPNWENYTSTKKDAKTLPLYPNFKNQDGAFRSVIHIKDYEPDFDWYGVPSYITALDAAAIGYKTNKWNVSRLDNAFQTSGVLVVDGNMSDDDAKALKDDFAKEMTGEGNQGKVMLIIKKLGGEGTEFTPINTNTEGDWIQLHNQSSDDILQAANWRKSLIDISENTGFDTKRVLNDYQIVKSTFIEKEQTKFIREIKKILKNERNIDLDGLTFINKAPVSMLTELTADKYIRVWEARRDAGEEYDSEDANQQIFVAQVAVAKQEVKKTEEE